MERSETGGVKKIISNYKNSLSHFSAKNDSPLKDGAEAQIEFDIEFGQGQALFLPCGYSIIPCKTKKLSPRT